MTSSMPFAGDDAFGGYQGDGTPDEFGAPTGRYVVVLSDEVHGDESQAAEALRSVTGATDVASTSDFEASALDVDQVESADATFFNELGLGVVQADPDQVASIIAAAEEDSRVLAVEPENILHALQQPEAMPLDYLEGYRDAAEHLYEQAVHNGGATTELLEECVQFADTPTLTWGLQATNVARSSQSGQGHKVAVLDTGFDLQHPDFAGRPISSKSFVQGQPVQDGHGHGTHCTGTACGPLQPPRPPGSRRYGVAYGADIFVGKALGNRGSGTDLNIFAGIGWAVANGCRVMSMSAGADIRQMKTAYEVAGRRALAKGTLIVAAAGGNANRQSGNFGFVGVPANCESIMAVGAVDSQLRIASFSPRSDPVAGGNIDLVAPGSAVYSSVPMSKRYNTFSGTSSATAHVSGIAALWAQKTGATGLALWALLVRNARRLNISAVDAGAGLVQAPR